MASNKIRHNGEWIYVNGVPGRTTTGSHVYSHNGSTQGEMDIDSSISSSGTGLVTSGTVAAETNAIEAETSAEFNSTNAYAIGDYCTKDNVLYRFTSAHTAGSSWDATEVTSTTVCAELIGKKNTPGSVTSGTVITLADNTEYRLTDVTSLTLTYPSGNFEVWMSIKTAETGTIVISFPVQTTEYIGSVPSFGNNETWDVSIKDGIVAAAKVVSS